MLAITGANGQLGQHVITSLLEKTAPGNVIGLVRDPSKASVLAETGISIRQADYNQPESLVSALQGVTKMLLISSSEVGQRVRQHQAVIDAAKTNNVSLLAYTSILRADISPLMLASEHKATEEAIHASNIPSVILRNGWYTENYVPGLQGVLEGCALVGAAHSGIFATAERKDYAAAAAAVLTSNTPQAGNVYELAGDEGFTLAQMAEEIAQVTGKPIEYVNQSTAEFTAFLTQHGVPEAFAEVLANADTHAANGWLNDTSGTLGQLIGHPTRAWQATIGDALNTL